MAKRVLNEFIEYLRDFVYKSNFMEFFNMHKGLYESIVEKSKLRYTVPKMVGYLEDFFKKYEEDANIILCPLYSSFGFGHKLDN